MTGSVLVLLLPAIWNGYPFMFYDTGAFIELAVAGGFKPERSALYGAFLAAFWPRLSLWPAMVAQVWLTVLVMAAFARAVLPDISPVRFFIFVVLLTLGTSLPWIAPEVLPDIMAPLLVLCLYLLGFHRADLGPLRLGGLVAVSVLAITSHASHLALAAGLVLVVALLQLLTRGWKFPTVRPRFVLPGIAFVLALGLLVCGNYALTGDIFVSRAGSTFLLGRFVQDGIAKRVLDDTCPASGYRLCPFKDNLPADSNDFLWGSESPFRSLGGFDGMTDEASSIVMEGLKRYPLLNLKTALLSMGEQLVTFQTGDGIEPSDEIPVPAIRAYLPDQLAGYRASRQQRNLIAFDWINWVQVPLGALSIAVLVVTSERAALRRQPGVRLYLPAFLLAALLGNAFICGALSSPHHRYQSRMMWVASFAVLLLVMGRSQAWPGLETAVKRARARFIGPSPAAMP